MPAKLRVEGLSYARDGRRILDDVDLTVRRGERVAVVGPSGAGKSTLLRMLDRLEDPDAGRVLLDGTDVREVDPREIRRRVGLVPQDAARWEGTVLDNVLLGPRLRGEDPEADRARELLDHVGLVDRADQDAADLSGGEAERVALARTLMNGPEVLLLDEPTANLDPETERDIEQLILDLVDDLGLTTVLVTHDPDQARRLADRVHVLEQGRIVRSGTPAEVLG